MIQEKKYTAEDVLKELKQLIPKAPTRKRSYLDQRNYLICILYYKFNFTEESIAEYLDIKRPTVCLAKKNPIKSLDKDDVKFEINTMHLYDKFPYMVPRATKPPSKARARMVFLDTSTLNRIHLFKDKYHIDTTTAAIKLLIGLGLTQIEKESIDFDIIWNKANKL
jgi:hypothetical protein